jgi:hypothetical protein
MENFTFLSDVTLLQLGPISDKDAWYYTSKFETHGFQLTVDNDSYPYPNNVSKNETFVFPSAFPNKPFIFDGTLDYIYSFDHEKIISKDILDKWPFGGLLTGYFINLSYTPANEGTVVIGNVSYIASGDPVPEEQDGTVFLIEEEEGCEDQLDNMTNVTGCILLHDYGSKAHYFANASAVNCTFAVVRVDRNDSNLTQIKQLLENGTWMIVDNMVETEMLTFTYNLTEGWWPDSNFSIIDEVPNPYDLWNTSYPKNALIKKIQNCTIVHYIGIYGSKTMYMWVANVLKDVLQEESGRCKCFILYESYNSTLTPPIGETHIMNNALRQWKGYSYYGYEILPVVTPGLPTFSVNHSVGSWLEEHRNGSDTTISGYINQTFTEETHAINPSNSKPGVTAYNVVGYKNITCSPNDKIVVISNRYDGWWGETPGDSGAGAGIVLGIAKYFYDHSITPKYNLTFLETTGEEYGFRGAFHFSHSYPESDYNITRWIGTDQLAFNQSDTTLGPWFNNVTDRKIVWAIANETNYENRSGFKFAPKLHDAKNKSGAEDMVWRDRSKTICFVKDDDRRWYNWHRAGKNHTEGDALKNINRTDLNMTFELVYGPL